MEEEEVGLYNTDQAPTKSTNEEPSLNLYGNQPQDDSRYGWLNGGVPVKPLLSEELWYYSSVSR